MVLVNLVVNAMDAMAETPPARRHVTISSKVRATDVEVSVRDTGPGLRADIIGRLFTPFVTTKSHGLGIGLTIARRIVDAHGGTIDAHNNPEGGATFTVTLRRSETPELRVASNREYRQRVAERLNVGRDIQLSVPVWEAVGAGGHRMPVRRAGGHINGSRTPGGKTTTTNAAHTEYTGR